MKLIIQQEESSIKVRFNPVSLKCFTGILLKFTELPSFDDSSVTL